MKSFWKRVLKGLATILPLLITLYIVLWLFDFIESLFGGIIKAILPDRIYVPGMGILGAVVLLYFIGRLMENRDIVGKLFQFLEGQIDRVPVIKTIYSSARDLMQFISVAKEGKKGSKQVVLVTLEGDLQLIGFITGGETEQIGSLPEDEEERVAVFIPMSYQIGGFTVYLPRSCVKPLDMSVEEAMRVILSAGMAKSKKK